MKNTWRGDGDSGFPYATVCWETPVDFYALHPAASSKSGASLTDHTTHVRYEIKMLHPYKQWLYTGAFFRPKTRTLRVITFWKIHDTITKNILF